jgi:hypothetical protein
VELKNNCTALHLAGASYHICFSDIANVNICCITAKFAREGMVDFLLRVAQADVSKRDKSGAQAIDMVCSVTGWYGCNTLRNTMF